MTEAVKKNGLNFGIILGVIGIVVTTLIYTIDINMFVSIWLGICLFLVNLIIGIVAVVKTKKALGGLITFKEAFTTYFITMALGALINTLFMFILFNFIDPSAKEIITEKSVETTAKMMQGFGAKTEDIKSTIEQIKATDNWSAFNLLKSYLFGLVFYIIIGLIVAAAFKNKTKDVE
jgi:hypothetical protein